MKDEDRSIEDLCKPLSAKVMPKSMLYTADHQPRSNEEAAGRARQRMSMQATARRLKAQRNAG